MQSNNRREGQPQPYIKNSLIAYRLPGSTARRAGNEGFPSCSLPRLCWCCGRCPAAPGQYTPELPNPAHHTLGTHYSTKLAAAAHLAFPPASNTFIFLNIFPLYSCRLGCTLLSTSKPPVRGIHDFNFARSAFLDHNHLRRH